MVAVQSDDSGRRWIPAGTDRPRGRPASGADRGGGRGVRPPERRRREALREWAGRHRWTYAGTTDDRLVPHDCRACDRRGVPLMLSGVVDGYPVSVAEHPYTRTSTSTTPQRRRHLVDQHELDHVPLRRGGGAAAPARPVGRGPAAARAVEAGPRHLRRPGDRHRIRAVRPRVPDKPPGIPRPHGIWSAGCSRRSTSPGGCRRGACTAPKSLPHQSAGWASPRPSPAGWRRWSGWPASSGAEGRAERAMAGRSGFVRSRP